jgi:polyisoprenoid-binding protein YceI
MSRVGMSRVGMSRVGMKRRLVIAGVSVVVLAVASASAVYFTFLRCDTAPPLRLQPASASPVAPVSLPGGWQVVAGSEAGYRINEEFLRDRVHVEAVGRTSTVSGGLVLADIADGGFEARDVTVTVDLTTLRSDQPARDEKVFPEFLEPGNHDRPEHPNATFTAPRVAVPATARDGRPFSVTATGRLTLRGVTREVPVQLECQLVENQIRVAGSVPFTFDQFGISQLGPAFLGFVAVEPKGVIEFLITFAKAG